MSGNVFTEWLFNQIQTDTKEDAETCKRIVEAQDEVEIHPQDIDTFRDGWCYTFESNHTIPYAAYQQIVQENPSMSFIAMYDNELEGITGSIWAPGDGTACKVEVDEPYFDDDDKARDAWWAERSWDARINEEARIRLV